MIDGRGPALLDDIAGQVRMRHIPEDATVPTLVYLKDCRNVTQIFTEVLQLFTSIKNLSYFEDAESSPMPDMIVPVDWDVVKSTIRSEVAKLF